MFLKTELDQIYYHPFHARIRNKWILVEKKDDTRYSIPFFGIETASKPQDLMTVKYDIQTHGHGHGYKPQGIIEFEFDPNRINYIKITKRGYIYELYWFHQIRGQCVLHTLRAILQDTKFQNCADFQRYINGLQDRECRACGKIIKSVTDRLEHNNIALGRGQFCPGTFAECAVENYLVTPHENHGGITKETHYFIVSIMDSKKFTTDSIWTSYQDAVRENVKDDKRTIANWF
eukprot:UN03699